VATWLPTERVIRETLREYYPEGQDFLLRNLAASVERFDAQSMFATVPEIFENILSTSISATNHVPGPLPNAVVGRALLDNGLAPEI
jgi:hypothetical protein